MPFRRGKLPFRRGKSPFRRGKSLFRRGKTQKNTKKWPPRKIKFWASAKHLVYTKLQFEISENYPPKKIAKKTLEKAEIASYFGLEANFCFLAHRLKEIALQRGNSPLESGNLARTPFYF